MIDADKLFVNMDKGMQGSARDYLKFYQMAVRDEPTAYDVDKVVGQLEQKAEESRKYWSKHDDECAFGEMNAYRNSVKIVKSGGNE